MAQLHGVVWNLRQLRQTSGRLLRVFFQQHGHMPGQGFRVDLYRQPLRPSLGVCALQPSPCDMSNR
jgi:hypothetical protein